ncbi:DEAD/DEAH box helicase [Bacillus sp. AFS051223]|nr:DEAD/DEAH box helicase [Bacillus sp. AFS051223]
MNGMNTEKLINQLDRETLLILLERLKKIQVQRDLFSNVTEHFSKSEIKILAEAANMLAMSSDDQDKIKALEIAISLPQVMSSKGVLLCSFLTLRKLGNFPAIKLLEDITGISEYKDLLNGITAFEEYIFESFNEREVINKKYLFTDFQNAVYDNFYSYNGFSVSAPTSAGKSFIFIKNILNFINAEKKSVTVIYIVPTRALINQVMNDLLGEVMDLELKNIYIGCSSEIENVLKYPEKSNILVLTQERLFQLCTQENVEKLNVKLIITDEAHNIQSDGRGILLESALKSVQAIFPKAKLLFSSPLVSNPEKFLTTFNIENGNKEKNNFPLVSQNIIKVNKKSKKLHINVIYQDKEIEICEIPFQIKSKAKAKVLANIALELWNNNTSIIYSSEPMLSTDVARELVNSGQFPELNDESLNEFADFIEEFISKDYELAHFIRCGIAFHFGALPPIIRSGIEELFKSGALKIVSCTSTLLEGVNMPAKNIFMYKPESGQKPLDKLNFWNLAGRAGRMGNDFSGNIILIDLEQWDINPLMGVRSFPIIPSSESKLINDVKNFRDYINDRNKPSGIDDYNEQLVSMVVRDRILGNKLADSSYKTNLNEMDLNEIDFITERIITDFIPPHTLLKDVQGVMPDRINDLWKFFEKNKSEYKELIPLYPVYLNDAGFERFEKIIISINQIFMNNTIWSDKFIQKISITGYKWMTGYPLSTIIFYKPSLYSLKEKKLTSFVKQQIHFLNDTIRYKMVKYFQIYLDVLKVFLESINKKEEAERLIKISSFLEFGACSTPALEFMAIGLPREAAIRLDIEFGKNHRVADPNYYLEWLKSLDVNALEMPNYLKKQIVQVQQIL